MGLAPEHAPRRPSFASYYSGLLGGGLFRWLDWAKIRVLERVIGRRPGLRRVVDLGCGSGGIAARLAARRSDLLIIGLDHSLALLRDARARGVRVVLADFEKHLPFADGQLDVVLMADTIEHSESPKAIVAEVRRLLAPGGVFVVFTPPYDTLAWLVGERLHRIVTRRCADHISPFTRESLVHLLRATFAEWDVGTLNFGLTMYGIGSSQRPL